MSPAPAEQVNAKELAGRAAEVSRSFDLGRLARTAEAGALEGTHAEARLVFGTFEGRTTIDVQVTGVLVLPCQRCLRPCEHAVDETARLVVVADEATEVPGGYDPWVGDPERLSITDVVEEQLLLATPLVPTHEDVEICGAAAGAKAADTVRGTAPRPEEKQRPFANLRDLLERKNER